MPIFNNDNDFRQDLISIISDLYKDIHGVRPRFARWEEYSDEQLQAWIERLAAEAEELQGQYEWEQYIADINEEEARAEVPNLEDAWDRYSEYEVD